MVIKKYFPKALDIILIFFVENTPVLRYVQYEKYWQIRLTSFLYLSLLVGNCDKCEVFTISFLFLYEEICITFHRKITIENMLEKS